MIGNIFKLFIFFIVLAFSFFLLQNGSADSISQQSFVVKIILSFLAGFFYTSFLTAPLSAILLVSLAFHLNPLILSVVAGMGAVVSDLLIVKALRFLASPLSSGLSSGRLRNGFVNFKKKLKVYHFDFVAVVLGSFIVASPLPDELGLALLGVSNLSFRKLAALTFLLNGGGILMIVTIAERLR